MAMEALEEDILAQVGAAAACQAGAARQRAVRHAVPAEAQSSLSMTPRPRCAAALSAAPPPLAAVRR